MKLIICGSRTIINYETVKGMIEKGIVELKIKDKIDEVVSGRAIGVDRLGEQWAKENNIPVKVFLPDWELGKRAGPLRNIEMCEYAKGGALICVHDGISKGCLQCYNYGRENGVKCVIYEAKIEPIAKPKEMKGI